MELPRVPQRCVAAGDHRMLRLDPANPTTTGPERSELHVVRFSSPQPNFATGSAEGRRHRRGRLSRSDRRPAEASASITRSSASASPRRIRRPATSRGMQEATVPDSVIEHDDQGNYVGNADANANCVNPIYAQNCRRTGTARRPTRATAAAGLVRRACLLRDHRGVPHSCFHRPETEPAPPAPRRPTVRRSDADGRPTGPLLWATIRALRLPRG